ncbi:MAG: glycosyltransferase [Eubacterium sp.]
MNYLISIVVPVYKVEKYLDRCVESIINQTYTNLEIILVDDGSPDNCPEMCDEWAKKDGRIKVIHKQNDGLANARNSGIELCLGDYVMFVDSDDYIEPDMVEFLLNISIKYDADVSRCGFFINTDNDEKIESQSNCVNIPDNDDRIIDLATSGLGGVAWNKLYKRDVIKNHFYDKTDGCSEDIMHNYRVYRDIDRAVFCDIPKYHYVIRDDSITNNTFGYGAFDIIRAKKIILNDNLNNERVLPYVVKGYITSAFIVLSGCIQNNMFENEQKELISSILKYRKEILFSKNYSKADKLKTLVLCVSPKLYKLLIRRIHT